MGDPGGGIVDGGAAIRRSAREGVMTVIFEILIGAIVVAAVANLLIGLLPSREKTEPVGGDNS